MLKCYRQLRVKDLPKELTGWGGVDPTEAYKKSIAIVNFLEQTKA